MCALVIALSKYFSQANYKHHDVSFFDNLFTFESFEIEGLPLREWQLKIGLFQTLTENENINDIRKKCE